MVGEAGRLGVGAGVEGALLATAGPEAAAGQLVRVILSQDPDRAVRDAAGVRRGGPAGEPGAGQVHRAPEEVHRAGLANKAGPELPNHALSLQELTSEQLRRIRLVGG